MQHLQEKHVEVRTTKVSQKYQEVYVTENQTQTNK